MFLKTTPGRILNSEKNTIESTVVKKKSLVRLYHELWDNILTPLPPEVHFKGV